MKIVAFIKKNTVLAAAFALALLSMAAVPPSAAYLSYIDWRSLGILWSLMVIMQYFQEQGLFERIGRVLLARTKTAGQLAGVLVGLCFFFSMFITNDVALITFVPFAILLLTSCKREDLLIPVIVLQTIAANLGSMLLPVGNPQNLYLYGVSGKSLPAFIGLMLPYSMAAAVVLILCVLCLKGRKEPLIGTLDSKTEQGDVPAVQFLAVYGGLFVLALLTVCRVVPWVALVAAVFAVTAFADRKLLKKADYGLLFTFIGFFIFTGNLTGIPAVSNFLAGIVGGREVAAGILASQVISNVPAALLLSNFTENVDNLIVGVNIGGLGTLIASMASLISFKFYSNISGAQRGRYVGVFTLYNLLFLAIYAGMLLL